MSNVVLTKEADTHSAKKHQVFKNLEKQLEAMLQDNAPKSRVSFGFMVLQQVAQGNYERALAELESVGGGIDGYPEFKERANRYIDHAKSLVMAIKTKKNIGLSPHINRSKQKELSEKIAEHFADLKKCIIIIEKIEKGIRAQDLSATVYLLKAGYYSIALVTLVTLLNYMRPDFDVSFMDLVKYFFWPE